jgi:hypothetical protein
MSSLPIKGASKANLFVELQQGSKSEILDRLLLAKLSTNELAVAASSDAIYGSQQIIL